ncbi:DUF2333 family protein [Pseudomonas aeruginosa]
MDDVRTLLRRPPAGARGGRPAGHPPAGGDASRLGTGSVNLTCSLCSRTPRPPPSAPGVQDGLPATPTGGNPKEVVDTLADQAGRLHLQRHLPAGHLDGQHAQLEYGVLVQVRDISRALRKDFARSQSQSTEDATRSRADSCVHLYNKS